LCVRVDECARNVIVGDYVRVHVHECWSCPLILC